MEPLRDAMTRAGVGVFNFAGGEQKARHRFLMQEPKFPFLPPTNQRYGFATRAEAGLYADFLKRQKWLCVDRPLKML